MSVSASAPVTTPPATTPAASNNPNAFTSTDFMDLLTAQLKNQDPTNPVDPTQFVGQLVQFNSLEQLLGIKGDLDSLVSVTSGTPTPTPAPTTGGFTSATHSQK
jgi:flagellar basal-body rod modification protein FlgD